MCSNVDEFEEGERLKTEKAARSSQNCYDLFIHTFSVNFVFGVHFFLPAYGVHHRIVE